MSSTLTIRTPDDWHLHLRDGEMLQAVVGHTARQFARAIVMPNLKPPVTTVEQARAYRERITAALTASQGPDAAAAFTPLMTAYLTETIEPAELERGFSEGVFSAAKLYPAGATTNSDAGVRDLAHISAVLACMERIGMPLLIHGEVTDPAVDIFDREAVFIERQLIPLLQRHPALKVVLEHITTADAAQFVAEGPANLAATITPTTSTSTATPSSRGSAAGLLLLAHRQAGAPSPGPTGRGHQQQHQIFPGDRLRSPPQGLQGIGLRLRRDLQRPLRH